MEGDERRGDAGAARRGPLWSRAPVVLLRYPRLFASLTVGSLLVVVAVAASPLFLSSISAGLVAGEISEPLVTRYGAGVRFTATNQDPREGVPGGGGSRLEARDRMFAELTRRGGLLDPPEASILGPAVTLESPDRRARTFPGRPAFGTSALEHVEVMRGDRRTPGAWVPQEMALALRLTPGETVRLRADTGAAAEVTVAGVHGNLYSASRTGYWLQWAQDIYPSFAHCDGPCREPVIPPQLVLFERDALLDLLDRLGVGTASFGWQAPLRAGARLTIAQARDLHRFTVGLRAQMGDRATEVGRVFGCCGRRHERYGTEAQDTSLTSRIGQVVDRVEERVAAIEAPGRVLQIAGIVVALSVLAGAGSFSVAARTTEGRLLFARGMSPWWFGARSSLETALPALAGGAAGLGVSFLLTATVGPGGPVASADARTAALGAAGAVVAAILAVGVVSGTSYHARFEHRSGRLAPAARLPWELVLLAVAAFSFRRLEDGAALVAAGGIRRPGLFLLLFPLAFLGGTAGLGARLLRRGAAGLSGRSGRLRASAYLAVHRLAAGSLVVVLLVASAGLAFGLFLHSGTVVRSLRDTVRAKAHVFVGADVQAWVSPDVERPAGFPFPVTRVTRIRDAGTLPDGFTEFDLLAVDPSTLASAASWDGRFADEPFEELASRLEAGAGPLPVIVAGEAGPGFSELDLQDRRLPVLIVGRTRAFPGMLGHRPLVVVSAAGLTGAFGPGNPLAASNSRAELWFHGPTRRVVDAIGREDVTPFQVLTADRIEDIPYVAAVVQTFVVLNALGLAAAVLVVAALLMYLEARQRSQLVSYGLSVRMGMTGPSHARSLALEVGVLLLGALVVGGAGGLVAAYLVGPRLDPLTSIPPGPLFAPPVAPAAVAVAAVVAVAWLGGRLTELRARRVPLGEVMRVAED